MFISITLYLDHTQIRSLTKMATHEKQKRRSFMNFYKSKPKNNLVPKPAQPVVVTDKPMMSPAISLPRKSDYGDERANPMMSPAISLPRKSDCREETIIKPMMSPMLLPRKSNHSQETAGHHDGPRRSIDGRGRRLGAVEGPRKSVSQVETNLASVVAFLQVKVLVTDMPGFMQVHAFRCARTTYDSLEKFSSKHIAYNMKKEFDKVYGPAWHCIVGSSFGSFVTHSTGCFLYFSMEKLYILVFKTKVQKALD